MPPTFLLFALFVVGGLVLIVFIVAFVILAWATTHPAINPSLAESDPVKQPAFGLSTYPPRAAKFFAIVGVGAILGALVALGATLVPLVSFFLLLFLLFGPPDDTTSPIVLAAFPSYIVFCIIVCVGSVQYGLRVGGKIAAGVANGYSLTYAIRATSVGARIFDFFEKTRHRFDR